MPLHLKNDIPGSCEVCVDIEHTIREAWIFKACIKTDFVCLCIFTSIDVRSLQCHYDKAIRIRCYDIVLLAKGISKLAAFFGNKYFKQIAVYLVIGIRIIQGKGIVITVMRSSTIAFYYAEARNPFGIESCISCNWSIEVKRNLTSFINAPHIEYIAC